MNEKLSASESMNPAVTPATPIDTDEIVIETIVGRGPAGAFAVAGIATAVVVVLYLAFYFFAYLPRGIVQ